jgi:DNA-binding NarL/FixJ family response regulator
MQPARFLIVEDEVSTARTLARLVRTHGIALIAGSVREALALLRESPPCSGLILDLGLPDGSGLDVLAQHRTAHPRTPAVILTGSTERDVVNRAQSLGAGYLLKPVRTAAIEGFLRAASEDEVTSRVERFAQLWAERYDLSDAHAHIFRLAARGHDRASIARERGTSEATVKTQVSSLLKITGDASLRAAIERLLREVAKGT